MNRLRRILDARLQPAYLTALSGAIVLTGLALAVSLFCTSDRGRTSFGIPLGADFAGFYVAAEILNRGQTQQLYDRSLHDHLYHELLPNEDKNDSIPYVHPPFVAGLLKPLAQLPYPVAVGIWQIITVSLYVAGNWLLLKSISWQPGRERSLIILLALSFEPFLFECWIGGQLSAVAFCCFALYFAAMQRGKPLLAGMGLGLALYKPTILLLIVPLLVVGRRWRVIAGMTLTGLALVLISVLLVGWDVNVGYLNVLLSFQKSTSGGDLQIRTWKYVDLNHCLRLLLGNDSAVRLPLLAVSSLIPAFLLARLWWRHDRLDETSRRGLWAATVTWTPVLNLYFGIYDSILLVQSLIITAAMLRLQPDSKAPLTESGFAYLALAIYVAPWFSQNLAALTGVPVYTLLLITLGSFQLRGIFRRS